MAARKENESRTNPTARMAAHHSSITYEDGSLYEGTLHPQSGLPHGEGMMKFSDGSVYSISYMYRKSKVGARGDNRCICYTGDV